MECLQQTDHNPSWPIRIRSPIWSFSWNLFVARYRDLNDWLIGSYGARALTTVNEPKSWDFMPTLLFVFLFPFSAWDRIWNLIVSVPGHCLLTLNHRTVVSQRNLAYRLHTRNCGENFRLKNHQKFHL